MFKLVSAALLAALISLGAAAQTGQGPEAAIKRTIEERFNAMKVLSVTRTQYSGMFEIRTDDNEIFYTDDKVSFLFVGSVRDGQNPQRNLTEERIQQLTAIKWSDMPLNQAFRIVRGNGRRQLAYFSDPNCPYCRTLERELLQLENVTLHVFLLPILAADSLPKSRAVWCSADRAKAWNDLMLNGVQPGAPAGNCQASAIEQNLALGKRLRVQSVPTLLFTNGQRIAGFRPASEISKQIDAAAAGSKS